MNQKWQAEEYTKSFSFVKVNNLYQKYFDMKEE